MCFFPFPNTAHKSEAYKKGIREFDCGCCPECLSKRARLWALRCSAEAVYTPGIMVTLTYDDYKYDHRGKPVAELPVNPDIKVDKRHCQLFIKRLRAHFAPQKLKFLLTAEYGKRTHRAHYHAILFGVSFDDMVPYKRSKRGNNIYKSATLSKLWGHGICTIDSVCLNASVARYCTKYCAKDSRCDDTFMLVSRGIGDRYLDEQFNGLYYLFEGQYYPIPKQVWNRKITEYYANNYVFNHRPVGYQYRSLKWYVEKLGEDDILANYLADYNARQRKNFRSFRDSCPLYKRYIEFWQKKVQLNKESEPSVFERLLALPNDKYFSYKQAALKCLVDRRRKLFIAENPCNLVLPPRYISKRRILKEMDKYGICSCAPCHIRANDSLSRPKRFTKWLKSIGEYLKPSLIPLDDSLTCPFNIKNNDLNDK